MKNKHKSTNLLMFRGLCLFALLGIYNFANAEQKTGNDTYFPIDTIQTVQHGEKESRESKDTRVYEDYEEQAQFPGGQEALEEYLKAKLKFHKKSLKKVTNQRIILRFLIDKDGLVSKVEVVRSSGDKRIDKEAVRVVRKMPRWIPASECGKAIPVKYNLPVSLKNLGFIKESETN